MCGAVASTTTFLCGLDVNKKILKPIVKNTINNTINDIKKIKNKLPNHIQDIIYECISQPIEQSLKNTHHLIDEKINIIKDTINKILCENWEKIKPNETIIYCEDLNQNKISISLNKQITTKIYDYCRIGTNNYYESINYQFTNNEFMDSNQNLSTFSLKYENFNNNFNSLQYNLNHFNFIDKINYQINYDKNVLKINRPNSSLLKKHHINPNTIPDYKVNIIIDGKDSNSGSLAGIGCCIAIAIQFSFIF